MLFLNPHCYYKLWMWCGSGSNTMGELLSSWLFLHFISSIGLDGVSVFGDSKVIIDWAKNDYGIHNLHISTWLKRTQSLINLFWYISFSHIFMSFNHMANLLSKKGHQVKVGFFFFEQWEDGSLVSEGFHRTIFCWTYGICSSYAFWPTFFWFQPRLGLRFGFFSCWLGTSMLSMFCVYFVSLTIICYGSIFIYLNDGSVPNNHIHK